MSFTLSLLIRHMHKKGYYGVNRKKLRKCIAKQRDMGRAIAQVKRKVFKPVTRLYHTIYQGKIECTTQSDMATSCIIFSQTRDTSPM